MNNVDLGSFLKNVYQEQDFVEADRIVALLWYLHHAGEESQGLGVAEIADLLVSYGFPKPNMSRLKKNLRKHSHTVTSNDRFRLNPRYSASLSERLEPLLTRPIVQVDWDYLPVHFVKGTRPYIEGLAYQINGAYQYRFFDACAVLCRRLMETLIADVFYELNLQQQILDSNGNLVTLDDLIGAISNNRQIPIGRGNPRTMRHVKKIGDRAAHDRYYITTQRDVDDIRSDYAALISALLSLANIHPKT